MLNGYTTKEAAAILDVSVQRVRQLASKISGVQKRGGVLLFSIRHIERMARRNKKSGPSSRKASRK